MDVPPIDHGFLEYRYRQAEDLYTVEFNGFGSELVDDLADMNYDEVLELVKLAGEKVAEYKYRLDHYEAIAHQVWAKLPDLDRNYWLDHHTVPPCILFDGQSVYKRSDEYPFRNDPVASRWDSSYFELSTSQRQRYADQARILNQGRYWIWLADNDNTGCSLIDAEPDYVDQLLFERYHRHA